jgi:hypothetical protein
MDPFATIADAESWAWPRDVRRSMSRITALILMSLCACGHPTRRETSAPKSPPTNHDASCLPGGVMTERPDRLQAQAELLKQLIMATERSDPEMPDLIVRLAEHHFQGGFVSAGCKIVEVATRMGDAVALAKATQLRTQSCFDDRARRCTTWYAPG